MGAEYDENIFYGRLIRGNLNGAMGYLKQYPEQGGLYDRYRFVFEQERYVTYDIDGRLNELLTVYQRYYRDVFYLNENAEAAAERMRTRFASLFDAAGQDMVFDAMENRLIAEAFRSRSFHFLGGKTGGYYGPYIWKTTETKQYDVELPDGVQKYTVRFLDGFLAKSWLDYLSFGVVSAGGWTDSDGIINCVKSSYDVESESFQVSLLKHEAQHAMDLSKYRSMSSEDLEYRAKLVELIYSGERNLLAHFMYEAGAENGHSQAAERIVEGFSKALRRDRGELCSLSIGQIQSIAKALFTKSNDEIKGKYA